MQFLMLVMEQRDRRTGRSKDDAQREYERMQRFVEELKGRGVYRASESLRSTANVVRIEARGGKRIVADGPFAEAKEMVGGFFLLECGTKEEATAIAAECPATEWATVELREVGPCYLD
jgi:hypothetical protein